MAEGKPVEIQRPIKSLQSLFEAGKIIGRVNVEGRWLREVVGWESAQMQVIMQQQAQFQAVNEAAQALSEDLEAAKDIKDDMLATLQAIVHEFEGYGHKDGVTMRVLNQASECIARYNEAAKAAEAAAQEAEANGKIRESLGSNSPANENPNGGNPRDLN